jgi:hypothetical protein
MTKKHKQFLFGILPLVIFGLLGGCASPARIDQMTVVPKTATAVANAAWKNQIATKELTGGSETNPLWTSQVSSQDFKNALEKSLEAAGLLASGESGKYYLITHLVNLDQPLFGLDMKVTGNVKYSVVERLSGRIVFEKTISIPFTATFSDAFIAIERLRIANEGAIKANIARFIEEILATKIDGVTTR